MTKKSVPPMTSSRSISWVQIIGGSTLVMRGSCGSEHNPTQTKGETETKQNESEISSGPARERDKQLSDTRIRTHLDHDDKVFIIFRVAADSLGKG